MKIGIRLRNCIVFCSLIAAAPCTAADSWSQLGSGLHNLITPPATTAGNVLGLAVNGGELYAVGSFDRSGSTLINRVAKWDGTSWGTVGTGSGTANPGNIVNAVAAGNGKVYVGGLFTYFFLPNESNPYRHVAKWDGASWAPLDHPDATQYGVDDKVNAIAVKGNRVYVGGVFQNAAGGTPAGGIAAMKVAYWENGSWSELGGSSGPVSTDEVHALAIDGSGNVYVGGQSAVSTPFLKKWVPGTPGAWTTISGLSAGRVYSLAVQGNDLYIGGSFTFVGSTQVKGVAKMNLSTLALSVLPAEPWNASGAYVRAIAHNGGNQIYFAGNLTFSGNPPAPYTSQKIVCLVNGTTWSTTIPAGTGLAAGANDNTPEAWALAVDRYGGKVYVGGNFSQTNGMSAINVASWNDLENIHITDLGPFTGGAINYAFGVNNSGQAAGYASGTWGGYFRTHAYRLANNVMSELTTPWYYTDNTYAYAINDSGHVVGSADQYGNGTYIRGIKWIPGQTPIILLPETGWTTTVARSIDNSERMVGHSRNPQGYYRAFRWDADYTVSDMDSLDIAGGNNRTSYAYGISASGKIVGKSISSGNGPYHAFRTTAFRDILTTDDLGTFPGGSTSEAWGINDVGDAEVVGAASTASGQIHAFLTKKGKKIDEPGTADDAYDLGVLGTGTASVAYSVNNQGMVVGSSYTSGGSYPEAFLYYRGKPGLIPLSSYVGGMCWTLQYAYGITDDGKIVGAGNVCGSLHGFLLDPNK